MTKPDSYTQKSCHWAACCWSRESVSRSLTPFIFIAICIWVGMSDMRTLSSIEKLFSYSLIDLYCVVKAQSDIIQWFVACFHTLELIFPQSFDSPAFISLSAALSTCQHGAEMLSLLSLPWPQRTRAKILEFSITAIHNDHHTCPSNSRSSSAARHGRKRAFWVITC